MTGAAAFLLVAAAIAFAGNLGAHYTGACMGMPYAAGAISRRWALRLMAPLALVGAVVASGPVEATVGHGLLGGGAVAAPLALAVVGSALALTLAYNLLALPTSTIQLLVFCVAGAGLAAGRPVAWGTIGRLVVVWAIVPPAAAALAYVATRLADARGPPARAGGSAGFGALLVAAGGVVSFVMGANDVSNASGALVMTGSFSLVGAAALGGVGLAVGVLVGGTPLLERVARRTVRLDRRTATIAQFVQGGIVLVCVAAGYFTSLNQALVGAIAGTGLARGRRTIDARGLRAIVVGWAVGPLSGLLVGAALARVALGA